MATFQTILMVIGAITLVGGVAVLACVIDQEVRRYRERKQTARRAIKAEWHIHQIGGDARARMWDEVTRHRGDDGG
jgi:hypothetical protein